MTNFVSVVVLDLIDLQNKDHPWNAQQMKKHHRDPWWKFILLECKQTSQFLICRVHINFYLFPQGNFIFVLFFVINRHNKVTFLFCFTSSRGSLNTQSRCEDVVSSNYLAQQLCYERFFSQNIICQFLRYSLRSSNVLSTGCYWRTSHNVIASYCNFPWIIDLASLKTLQKLKHKSTYILLTTNT